MLCAGTLAQWVAAGMAGGALMVAWLALRTSREAARIAGRAFARAALHDVILKSFIERPFVDGTGDRKVPVYDRPVTSLRQAKVAARGRIKTDPKTWAAHSVIKRTDRWENRVAYETADALTLFGLAVFTGMIPLNEAMANVADVVVDDWMICAAWVNSYRQQENVKKNVSDEDVHYHRRHAEWVYLVARLWLDANKWHYPDVYSLPDQFLDLKEVRRRLELLYKADESIMPPDVKAGINELLGKSEWRFSARLNWFRRGRRPQS
jgi:hypothetical protein